ncbi:MAG: retropepsin-like aspartic protease [Cyclobacteriaceae bacterium]
MTTVKYSSSRALSGNRPYSNITLLGGNGNLNVNFKALVDTGADYLLLPKSAASSAGINLNAAKTWTVHGATGTSSMLFFANVSVEVEGKTVIVDCLLDPTNSSCALLGRQCLLAAVEAGFNTTEWLWKY